MSVILCLETSSINCSVSLFKNDDLLASKELGETYMHSEKLHLFIQEVLSKAELSSNDIDAVAVGHGPGSFTGLRIGMAAAKGLCFALDIPLISISTLETMSRAALQFPASHNRSLCPLIDARRMEVYTCIFSQELSIERELDAVIVDENSFLPDLNKGPILFFGDGMAKIKSMLEAHENAFFLNGIMPSSLFMGKPAFEKFKAGIFEDVAYAEPLYYKDFQPTTPKKRL